MNIILTKTQIPRNTKFLYSLIKLFYLKKSFNFLSCQVSPCKLCVNYRRNSSNYMETVILTKWLKLTSLTKGQQTSWTSGCDTWRTHCLLFQPQMDQLILITRKSKQTHIEGQSIKLVACVLRNTNLNWDNHWTLTLKATEETEGQRNMWSWIRFCTKKTKAIWNITWTTDESKIWDIGKMEVFYWFKFFKIRVELLVFRIMLLFLGKTHWSTMGYANYFQVVQKITCLYIRGENYDMWKMLKTDESSKEHIEIILYYLCNLS